MAVLILTDRGCLGREASLRAEVGPADRRATSGRVGSHGENLPVARSIAFAGRVPSAWREVNSACELKRLTGTAQYVRRSSR